MSNKDREAPEVMGWIRSLGTQPDMPALPDPDRLWMRAQISARHAAAVRALRLATLRQALRYGILGASVVWLLLVCMEGEGGGLTGLTRAMASLPGEAIARVAISAIAALGIALLTGTLVLGRSLLARQLRYLGLL
jgi:hypothetical protein